MSSAGYRRLLKSVKFAFAGDNYAIKQAKIQLKSEFRKNANSTNMALHAQEIADLDEMLRFHIVQGKKSDKGNFEVNLQEQHHTTIAAGQHLQHGPELEPIDPTFVGKANTLLVNKTKGDKRTLDKNDLI